MVLFSCAETSTAEPEALPVYSFLGRPDVSPSPPPNQPAEERIHEGKSIDQHFQITGQISSIDDNGREAAADLKAGDYLIHIKDYVPQSLTLNGKTIFKFKRRAPGGYWSTLVGTSQLRGPESREIYSVASGPGGVCCTNYSIIDVSADRPRSIYHSEDFGGFRHAMEIFDAEGDGVYELMQFDSCFRYFMDDCGSCSPEPRAYFKYDNTHGQYLPATGIVQDFVRAGYQVSEKWLAEKHDEYQRTKNPGLAIDIKRSALAHMVDLLFIGEERRAWQIFDKYIDDPKGETRSAIKNRLRTCKFYQALKRR